MLPNLSLGLSQLQLSPPTPGSFSELSDGPRALILSVLALTLPASLTTIGEGAFRNCTALTDPTRARIAQLQPAAFA